MYCLTFNNVDAATRNNAWDCRANGLLLDLTIGLTGYRTIGLMD